jgi:hypothetical protein
MYQSSKAIIMYAIQFLTSTQPLHTTADYLLWADHIEQLGVNDCHPALYACRTVMAARLRSMSDRPQRPEHRVAFSGIRFVVYTPPVAP